MRIAICDDVSADRRAIKAALDEYLKTRDLSADVREFARPAELLAAVRGEPFDLYLLDVLLDDELTGIDLVRRLRSGGEALAKPVDAVVSTASKWKDSSLSDAFETNASTRSGGFAMVAHDKVPVIFFSTSREYAVDAFAVEAISYLQKPWDKASFARVLDLAMECCRARQRSLLTFRTGTGVARFSASDIESVETAKTVNYITISRVDGHLITVRGSVRSFAEQCRTQVHLVSAGRSILVNPAQIATLEKTSVRFFSGRRLAVPHSALASLAHEILALSAP